MTRRRADRLRRVLYVLLAALVFASFSFPWFVSSWEDVQVYRLAAEGIE